MGLPAESLLRWVKRHLSDITEEGAISHFELSYASADGLFRLEQFDASAEETEEGEIEPLDGDELSGAIWSVAEDDARTRPGHIHRYSVLAYRAGADEHDSLTSFTIHGRMLAQDFIPTEPGTEQGVTSQLMRHNEQLMAMTARVIDSSMGKLAADLEAERAKRLALESSREEVFRLKENLLNDSEERESRRREEDRKAERMSQIMGMFISNAPLLLGALAAALQKFGRETTAQSSAQEQLARLISSLDETKLAQFAALIGDEKQSELVALLGELSKKESK